MPRSLLYKGKWTVYVLLDPRDKIPRYVGCTQYVRKRVVEHATRGKLADTTLGHWLKELDELFLFPEYEILETGSGIRWHDAEQEWIAHYGTLGITLFNQTIGGAVGRSGFVTSKETKQKIRDSLVKQEITRSASHRQKISEAKTRYWQEFRQKRGY